MSSQRHLRDPVLDALHAQVLEVGLRRTTLADVARRAGVSRMTVYRQYGDLPTVVGALLTRELTDLMAEVEQSLGELPTARDRLVEASVHLVERLQGHALYRRILDLDPELLLPFVVDRFGSTQRAARALAMAQVQAGQADGSVRPGEPALLATAVLLTCQSFVFSARLVDDAVLAELRVLLESYLR